MNKLTFIVAVFPFGSVTVLVEGPPVYDVIDSPCAEVMVTVCTPVLTLSDTDSVNAEPSVVVVVKLVGPPQL